MYKKLIRIAYENPELRTQILKNIKRARVFHSQEALDEYLEEHPNANPRNHSVDPKQSIEITTKEGIKLNVGSLNPKAVKKALVKHFEKEGDKIKQQFTAGNTIETNVVSRVSQKTLETLSNVSLKDGVNSELKQAIKSYDAEKKANKNKTLTYVGAAIASTLLVGNVVAAPIAIAATYATKKYLEYKNNERLKEEGIKESDQFAELSYDILRNKATPEKINNDYKERIDDLTFSLSQNDLKISEALKELEELQKEYNEEARPHIEKALDTLGFKKDDKGNYENKEDEDYAKSLMKKAFFKNADLSIPLAIIINDLTTQLYERMYIEEAMSDKGFLDNIEQLLSGKETIPKAEFEVIDKNQRALKQIK